MRNVNIRPAEPRDAEAVVGLIRESFRSQDVELTIYGCRGISEYLRRQFAASTFSAPPALVAEANGSIAGYVELRRTCSSLSLNYIAIDCKWRGHGIASALLNRAMGQADCADGESFTLEVFEHNTAAREWYTRLGFESVHRINILRARMPRGGYYRGAVLEGMPQADVCQEQFGFSSFTITVGAESFSVGRLGSRWFRISDPGLLGSPEALGILARMDTGRELLVIAPDNATHIKGYLEFEPLLSALKMHRCLPLPTRNL